MKHWHSIGREVSRLAALAAVSMLLITAGVSVFSFVDFRGSALESGRRLSESAADSAKTALTGQMEESALALVQSKAELADEKLAKFSKYVRLFAQYAQSLYAEPGSRPVREVLPPDAKNDGIVTMQRAFADESVSIDDVRGEVGLLGNMEDVFAPVVEENANEITTVYIGTESGVLLSCDIYSGLSSSEDSRSGGEEHYNFFDSQWYTLAKNSDGPVFTGSYVDSYGRGLMITCAAPIYDADGAFVGAVGMDILVADINTEILDISIGSGSYAALLNADGDVLAAPFMSSTGSTVQNIASDASSPAYEVAAEILSGGSGVVKTSQDIYYAYAPISATGWTLAVHIPQEEITAEADEIQTSIAADIDNAADELTAAARRSVYFFLALSAVGLVGVVLVANRFSKFISEPIGQLRADAEEISQGRLDYRSAVKADNELGELAASFNAMAAKLQRYISDLTAVSAEKERISVELSLAAQIQAHMLPCVFPPFPDRSEFDIYATMTPAKEVGGDFYDFYMVDDDHLAIVMADVSGKGVPAALFMMISKTLIKSNVQMGLSPKEVLERVNDQLCENNQVEMFVTVWLGILQISTGRLVCANAGHEYPAIKRRNGKFELFKDKHGFVVGGMEHSRYREYELRLAPGEMLFVYTDGVTEAVNPANELFGTERMLAALNAAGIEDAAALLKYVHGAVDAFAGDAPQFDDITMLCLRMCDTDTLTLDPSEPDALERFAAFAEARVSAAAVPAAVAAKIGIVVDEIGSNIVRYSAAHRASLTCTAENGEVKLIFRDNGIAFDPLAVPDPDTTLPADQREIGGLGICLVKKAADQLRYCREGEENVLTFVKKY